MKHAGTVNVGVWPAGMHQGQGILWAYETCEGQP